MWTLCLDGGLDSVYVDAVVTCQEVLEILMASLWDIGLVVPYTRSRAAEVEYTDMIVGCYS